MIEKQFKAVYVDFHLTLTTLDPYNNPMEQAERM